MYELRPYQKEAVDNVAKAFANGDKRVLIIAATASGKSIVIASLIIRYLTKYPNKRVLVLAHQSSLIKQNAEKIRAFCPNIPIGIYCAELGTKDTKQQIILASRDSLARKPDICGQFAMTALDEAHLASEELEKNNSQYGKIFCAQDIENLLVCGLTATPWRLKSGNIWGNDKFFKKVVYNIGTDYLIKQGFLSPYKYPDSKKIIDTDGIKKVAGDFNLGELEICSIKVVENCLKEWHHHANDRKLTLFFCVGKAHAKLVAEKLEAYLPKEAILYIDGETENKPEVIASIRDNLTIKAVVSIAVLTTGTDIPRIDCICMLRATQSVTLFLQCAGRGLRLYPSKENCLLLDFTSNTDRFKSLDKPFIPKTSGLQEAPDKESDGEKREGITKDCPECCATCSANQRVCYTCNHIFINHTQQIWEKKDAQWYRIYGITIEPNPRITKSNKKAYVIRYATLDGLLYQWVFVDSPYGMQYYNELRNLMEHTIVSIKGDLSGKIINIKELLIAKDNEHLKIDYYKGNWRVLEHITLDEEDEFT